MLNLTGLLMGVKPTGSCRHHLLRWAKKNFEGVTGGCFLLNWVFLCCNNSPSG